MDSSSDVEIVEIRKAKPPIVVAPRISDIANRDAALKREVQEAEKNNGFAFEVEEARVPLRPVMDENYNFGDFDVEPILPIRERYFPISSSPETQFPLLPPVKIAKKPAKAIQAEKKRNQVEEDESDMDNGVKVKRRKNARDDDDEDPVKSPSKRKRAPGLSDHEKAAKKDAKDIEKAEKAQAKKDEAELKASSKSVNLLINDRKDSIKELTLRISGRAFEEDFAGGTVGRGKNKESPWIGIIKQLESQLEDAGSKSIRSNKTLESEGSIEWTRLCFKRWNHQTESFDPLKQSIIVQEDSKLIFMTAIEISQKVADKTLFSHLESIRNSIPMETSLFLMLFKCNDLFSSLTNEMNAKVRAQIAGSGPIRKTVGIGLNQPTKDEIELSIMRAQIRLKLLVIHAEKEEDAVRWLFDLSGDISAKPYQKLKWLPYETLGEVVDIKVGKGSQSTYIEMLSKIEGVTISHAEGIQKLYPSWRKLFDAYRNCDSLAEREAMLVGAEKSRNKNGAASESRMGLVLSRKIYRLVSASEGSKSCMEVIGR